MNNRSVISIVAIGLVAINNNTIECLTGKGYPASVIMIYFGGISLLMNITHAALQRKRVFPRNWAPQLKRIIIDGTSVWMLFESFRYLSASSVAVIQRMDIPFLVLISFYAGQSKSSLQYYLSFWALMVLTFFVADAKFIDEGLPGFFLSIGSVILRASTYFLVQKQIQLEEKSVLNITYLFGILIAGIVISSCRRYNVYIETTHLPIVTVGSLTLFTIVQFALKMFALYPAEKARIPFVLGAMATMILEMIIERKVFSFTQIEFSILITGIIITIALDPAAPKNGIGFLRRQSRTPDR